MGVSKAADRVGQAHTRMDPKSQALNPQPHILVARSAQSNKAEMGGSLNQGALFWVPNVVRHPRKEDPKRRGPYFRELPQMQSLTLNPESPKP